ncbi:MAG: RNA-binding protein [Planctomycetota bacterium]|nr:MAG: RNA-binding protein [Planctomycetota bacterium]
MTSSLYVGNLPWKLRDDDLRALFLPHGEVRSARVMLDHQSGRSRGFGFVEMADESGAQIAIEILQGLRIDGRELQLDWDRQGRSGRDMHEGGGREDRGRPRHGARSRHDGPRRGGPRRDDGRGPRQHDRRAPRRDSW